MIVDDRDRPNNSVADIRGEGEITDDCLSFSLSRVIPACLLWDIDGTLIDTTELIVGALGHTYKLFYQRDLPEDDLRALIGIPLVEQMRIFGDPLSFGVDEVEAANECIRYYEANKHRESLIPEAIATLKLGRKLGCKTGIITSKNLAELENTLPRLGIADSVDLVVSADDVRMPKPDPEGILFALKHFGVSGKETVFIGDSIYDMRAGAGGGVLRCAVTWGAARREWLLAENPDLMCDDPDELNAVLGLVKK